MGGNGLPISIPVFGRTSGREVYVMKLRRMSVVGVACALSLALLAGLSSAQDEKKGPEAKTGKEEVKGKPPIYFGQIGLSKKQEDDVRKAAQPFDEKIVRLRRQVAELEEQMDELVAEKVAACERILTEGQKSALMARREQAEAEKEARKKKTSTSDSSKTDEQKP